MTKMIHRAAVAAAAAAALQIPQRHQPDVFHQSGDSGGVSGDIRRDSGDAGSGGAGGRVDGAG